ncbi:MAG: hypothetical protein CME43_01915 [Haliea sp.]|uniref:hypothetical protein n=1 Tax=Haliea sp. TaxID=1932666 RepID=UPI000C4039E7|nr:hypothetical protein [Haliea sp.]MBM68175.1 hypothetical protein [Haliea sp.]MBM68218.1 hypothetical protein [Haliea sp.]|tara:strand:- start:169 stop:564 length:396 start_codon:yes stop_codon:yes gene_type:complete
MTPEQKIKHIIIHQTALWKEVLPPTVTDVNVDDLYDELVEHDEHWDALYDVREGEVETNLPCPSSRHYESKSVASSTPSGEWVGWTYWYGGGKYSEPEDIDWMSEAYDLDCVETERLVTVREFSKRESNYD